MTIPIAGDPAADEPFQVEVTIAAPADVVWRALREKDQVLSWHGWEADGLDAEVDVIFFTNAVESYDDRRLVVNGGDTFDVVELGEASLVRMTRGPRDPSNEWDAYYDDINEGWTTFLHQLRFAVERHPGEPRRTIYLDGMLGTDPSPVDALDLARAASAGPSTPYAADVVDEHVRGEVLFTSAHQAGFTVAGWGDGLAIFGVAPPSPHRPTGGAMAVLTTYGLPDDRFAALEARWTDWWRQRYPVGSPDATDATAAAPEA